MKKQILEALQLKFQGASETDLSRIAEKMAKTVTTEEEVKSAVEAFTLSHLIQSIGDYRATEASKTAVQNYVKNIDKKETEKNEPVNKKDDLSNKKDDETPAWVKTLLEQNKALTDRLNKIEGEKLRTRRQSELEAVTKSLPTAVKKVYGRLNVEMLSDDEFTTLINEVKEEVGEIGKEIDRKGAYFGKPPVGQEPPNDGASKSEIDAVTACLNL